MSGELVAYIFGVVPHLWLSVAIAALVVLSNGVLLSLAIRALDRLERHMKAARVGDWTAVSRRVPHWRESVPLFTWLLVPALGLFSLRSTVGAFLRAQDSLQPAFRGAGMSQSIAGFLNAIPCTILLSSVVLLSGVLAWALTTNLRLRAQWLDTLKAKASTDVEAAGSGLAVSPPTFLELALIPGAFVLLGLGPVARGLWKASLELIHSQLLPGVDPQLKAVMMGQMLGEIEASLATWCTVSLVGVAVAIAISMCILVRWRRRAATQPELPTLVPGKRAALALSGSLAGGALILFALTWPVRAENREPWSPPNGFSLPLLAPVPADTDGPDKLERAPIVQLTNEGSFVDTQGRNALEFASAMEVAQSNWQLLHPTEAMPQTWLLACAPGIPVEKLYAFLAIAREAGLGRPIFTFPRADMVSRPFFGTVVQVNGTGARAAIADEGEEPQDALRVSDYRTCGDLTREIVRLRRNGQPVTLAL